jgi:hypothetical protein
MIFFIFTLKGFCYQRKEIKLSQYADDTQILLDGSEKSVRNTVLLNNFTKISGLKVNNNKFKLFIIVTFPNKVKLLLLHD